MYVILLEMKVYDLPILKNRYLISLFYDLKTEAITS